MKGYQNKPQIQKFDRAPGFEIPESATVMVPKATKARAANILFHTGLGVNLRIE